MFLQIEDLECRMASTNILRSCSLGVDHGEIVSLLGRNGAGKSSILKSIIGLYPSRMGKITLDGQDITRLPTHKRVTAGIAYAPEDSRLFPGLTVEENIQLGSWVRGESEGTGASISRALALQPSLVLLDESLEGLSPLVVRAFSDAMRAIKENLGVSILLAESNVHNASLVAERSYIIDRGEIIFEGYAAEILKNEELLKLIGK
jgi:branched-chain amino acid transport system ATP-binding protein